MSNRQARREQMKTNRQQRAAQRPAPQKSSGSPRRGGGGGGPLQSLLANPFYLVVGLVIVVGVAGLIALFALRDDADADVAKSLEVAHANFPSELADGVTLGKDDAPIKLTMYEDFQCPFCLKFTAEQEGEIIEEFVKDGRVQLTYKHLPILGRESLQAARGAQCAAEQGRFWEYKYEIFHLQAKEGQLSNEKLDSGRLSDDKLGDFAAAVGIDRNEWQRCFEDEESLAAVQADESEARSFGLRGTPGFAINGQPLGGGAPSSIDGWRQIFDQVLNATPTATETGTATAAATATPTP
ncbi:MAG: DsbA family protein [Dehalococcoidia bacterium]